MLDRHLRSPVTRLRLRSGPAADHIDGFADWLHRRGYTPITIDVMLRSLAGWTDWMRTAGFTRPDLRPGFVACKVWLGNKPQQRYRRGPNHKSLVAASAFIRFLQEQGVIPRMESPPSLGDRWPVLGDFRSWMRQHRGLTETTLDVYQGILVGLLDTLGDDPHTYTAEGLRGFVLERAPSAAAKRNRRPPPSTVNP